MDARLRPSGMTDSATNYEYHHVTVYKDEQGLDLLFTVHYVVGVAQWSEHWTVAPGVGGSSPLTHPK